MGTLTTPTSSAAIQLILLLLFLIPAILFLLTQFNILKEIRLEHRAMAPGWVWLQLIPLVAQIWQFVVVAQIATSIGKQWQVADEDSILGINAEAVGGKAGNRPTLGMGIAYCSLYVLALFLNLFSTDGLYMIAGSLFLASMICWIIYWVQLAGWKRRLKNKVGFSI